MLHGISFLRLGRRKEDKPHYLRLLRWIRFQSKWKLVLKEEFTNANLLSHKACAIFWRIVNILI